MNHAPRGRAALPKSGTPWSALSKALEAEKSQDYSWRKGRIPLYVYWRNEEAHQVSKDAFLSYFVENAMGKRAFPGVQKLEKEVIEMALGLLNAPEGAGGGFTSGGTESILQAVKTARDSARAGGRLPAGVKGKIVVPRTAHPAFNKAARYLDLTEVRIPIGADLRVDIAALEREIDGTAIMMVGSAPNFPHGIFDDVVELGRVAQKKDVWLHVDACVGGMLAPFMRKLGEAVPPFSFEVPGVTSLSVDLHKYGYASKGASLVLYRSAELLKFQRFEFDNWPRGFYGTETLLGTRPAGPVASAWAVMNFLGEDGYLEGARIIVDVKNKLTHGIRNIPGLEVVEPNGLSFVLYRSTDPELDINAIADGMGSRGWFVGRSVEPAAIHLMLNPVHAPVADDYLRDLREVAADVRRHKATGTLDAHTY